MRATVRKIWRAHVLREESMLWALLAKHVGLPIPTIWNAVSFYRKSGETGKKFLPPIKLTIARRRS